MLNGGVVKERGFHFLPAGKCANFCVFRRKSAVRKNPLNISSVAGLTMKERAQRSASGALTRNNVAKTMRYKF
jgi:hypothetical protein